VVDLSNVETKWREFVEENKIPKGIRPDILDSWIRCKKYKVDANNGRGKEIAKDQFNKILVKKKELIEIAVPIILDVIKLLNETNYSIILTDENAVVLRVIGNAVIMEENKKLHFLEGCQWKEEDVGTNAIGTCLYLDKPVQTLGAEHYCKSQHGWTCSSAPIHDDKGNLIGIINLSGQFHGFHTHTLGIVVEAANAIQKQFSINEHRKWAGAAFNSIEDGILVIDDEFTVKDFNIKICEILKISEKEIHKIDIKALLKDIIKDMYSFSNNNKINYREISLYIDKKRVECNVSVTPVKRENKYIGYVIFAKKVDSFRNVVNKIAGFYSKYSFDDILTNNPKMLSVVQEAKRIAANDCTVLITGESGTGKELFAHSIHAASNRCNGPFVAINCAALPQDLVESELFGYEKGAFTGASKEGCPGKFELANKGTIFLDEIGELPLGIQSKLLRVLDNHTITRIGGKYEKPLDVRVIAATNRILYNEIQTNNFRGDLYFRINVFNIKLVPLRERPEDVELCADIFLKRLNEKNPEGKKCFDKKFIDSIKKYNWPGNVRELENIIQRAYYLSKNDMISNLSIPEYVFENISDTAAQDSRIVSPEEVEKGNIIRMIVECNGNVIEAGKKINLSKSTIYRKIKKYNIDLDEIS
jgi:sigma-54 dependent transcriptional regulator, acetoin dehydrogenase operon transcriptional activator AcoR